MQFGAKTLPPPSSTHTRPLAERSARWHCRLNTIYRITSDTFETDSPVSGGGVSPNLGQGRHLSLARHVFRVSASSRPSLTSSRWRLDVGGSRPQADIRGGGRRYLNCPAFYTFILFCAIKLGHNAKALSGEVVARAANCAYRTNFWQGGGRKPRKGAAEGKGGGERRSRSYRRLYALEPAHGTARHGRPRHGSRQRAALPIGSMVQTLALDPRSSTEE